MSEQIASITIHGTPDSPEGLSYRTDFRLVLATGEVFAERRVVRDGELTTAAPWATIALGHVDSAVHLMTAAAAMLRKADGPT